MLESNLIVIIDRVMQTSNMLLHTTYGPCSKNSVIKHGLFISFLYEQEANKFLKEILMHSIGYYYSTHLFTIKAIF